MLNAILKNKENKSFILPLLVLALFFFYNITNSIVFFIGSLVIMAGMLVVCNEKVLLLSCCLFVPNIMMMRFSGHETAIVSYYILAICLRFLLSGRLNIRPIYFIHIFFVMITCVIYADLSLFLSAIRTIALLIYLKNVFDRKIDDTFIKKILLFFVMGVFLACFLGVMFYVIKGMNLYDTYYPFSGIQNDRNYFASLIAVALSLSIILVSYNKKYLFTLTPIGFFMVFCGLLTMSRTFILSMVFVVLLLIINGLNFKNFGVLLVFGLIALVILFIFGDTIRVLFNRVIERFESADVYTGNNRFELWQYYIELTFSGPIRLLFGNGVATQYLEQSFFSGGRVAHVEHNTFIQLISNLGFCGTVSLIGCYIATYRSLLQKRKYRISSFLPLLSGVLFYSSINALYSSQLDFVLFVSLLVIFLCSAVKKGNVINKITLYQNEITHISTLPD